MNLGYNVTDALRVAGGLRFNRDKKDVVANVGIGPFSASDSWSQLSYDLSASYRLQNGMNVYGSIQSGYQSGQFPARPYCLFGNPECLVASDNITAVNYELGLKGQVSSNFAMSVALFNTKYDDLPYQVSTTAEGGFSTTNLVVSQTSRGIEWESTLFVTDNLKLHTALGWIDVDVDQIGDVQPVAPLTPELTAAIGATYEFALSNGATLTSRVDYSFRGEMYGEPSRDPGRMTQLDSRELVNVDLRYTPANADWSLSLYGQNIFDERYDNARLNTGDYILRILSNDASEFGLRYNISF